MRKPKIYGYVRVSTKKQKKDRQIDNIKTLYPEALIFEEAYTGTTLDRPEWKKLDKILKAGDLVVFDEVSRMSRNAEEGFKLYKELYDRGVSLVFIKERTLDTENFRATEQLATVGNDIADVYIEATNRVLMMLAEKQIQKAFETAQHEVDFLHKRVAEGMATAGAGEKISKAKTGKKLTTKKSVEMKEKIRKMSSDFNGTLPDTEIMEILKLARNTYYKYKRELREEGV